MFGAIKLTKNSEIDKYEYPGYGIGFDSKGTFSHRSGTNGVNLVILGAGMGFSVHANNKTKNVSIVGEGFTQRLEDTTLYAKKMYPINFTVTRKQFCLNLHVC